MGLLSFLGFSRATTKRLFVRGDGEYQQDVVGESHYQLALTSICNGKTDESREYDCSATLVPEANNPHDRNAIRVDINGMTVGYLSRSDAEDYRHAFRVLKIPIAPAMCKAVILGGWDRGARGSGSFGVRLDLVWPLELSWR